MFVWFSGPDGVVGLVGAIALVGVQHSGNTYTGAFTGNKFNGSINHRLYYIM